MAWEYWSAASNSSRDGNARVPRYIKTPFDGYPMITQNETFTVNWSSALAGYVLQQSVTVGPDGWEDIGVVDDNGLNVRMTTRITDNNPEAVNEQQLSTEGTFTLTVAEVNLAPFLAAVEPQTIPETAAFGITVVGSDPDVPGNALTYELLDGPTGLSVSAESGLIAWTPGETAGGQTFEVMLKVTDSGEPAMSVTSTFSIAVKEINSAPTLTVSEDRSADELTLVSASASATDSDDPANTLAYSIVNGPEGAVIDAATGAITWTPTEAQGPGEHVFTIRVTDNGEEPLSDEKSFTVTVNEVNAAPILAAIEGQTIDELSTLDLKATGSDSDAPANALIYSLTEAPEGAVIAAATGTISWTPTESQGGGTHNFTVNVEDNGVPALSASVSFSVTVNEANSAPVITEIKDFGHRFGTPLDVKVVAADGDDPVNTLIYSLDVAPSGLAIDATTADVNWTPGEDQIARPYS